MGGCFYFNLAADTRLRAVTDWWLEVDQENNPMPKLGIDDGQDQITAFCRLSAAEMWPQTRLLAGFRPDTEPSPLLS